MWDLRDVRRGTGREPAERPDEWMPSLQHELRRLQTVPARCQMRLAELKVRTHCKTACLAYTFADCRSMLTRNAVVPTCEP